MSENSRSALFMIIAMAGYGLNDTFVKLTAEQFSSAQIILLRSLFASVFLLAVLSLRKECHQLHGIFQPLVLFRTLADAAATLFYVSALSGLQLTAAAAIYQTTPLAVALGASVVFKEKIGAISWLAIVLGFLGVLIIVRPVGATFNNYTWFVVGAVLASTARDLATRKLKDEHSSFTFATLSAVSSLIIGGLLCITSNQNLLNTDGTLTEFSFLFAAALAIAIGYVTLALATKSGDFGFVGPFRYSILVYATLLGYIVLHEVPDLMTLIGSGIIVISGILTLLGPKSLRPQSEVERTRREAISH